MRTQVEKVARTTLGLFKISQENIREMVICVPPLAEQKRIAAKVDSLFPLCDALEAKLKAAQDSSSTLMKVAARQVLAV